MKNLTLSFLIFALALASGCATAPDTPPSAAELYAEARSLANAADYENANNKYNELKSTYPTSPYAQQAVLEQIYGYLQRREFALAIAAADEFILLYPDHPQTPYAMYMKGTIYFRQDRGLLDKIGRQDPTERDSFLMRLSFEAYRELVDNYPDSEYTPDAVERMRYLINGLAKSEIHVATFYYEQGAYSAAIARAQNMLETYPDSTSNEDALVILMRAYEHIGAYGASQDAREVLEINFPENPALKEKSE